MKKRIAIFNDFQRPIPPVKGGSVPNLINMLLLENEIKQKFDIDVYVCDDKKAREESKKYKHTRFIFVKDAGFIRFMTNVCFKLKLPVDLSQIPLPLSAKRFYKKQKYDMVYIVAYVRGALPVIRISDAPCVYHHHTVTDILHNSTIKGKELADSVSRMYFVSDFARDFAKSGTEEENAKMYTFPNAIDTEKFERLDRKKARLEIREKYRIKENDTVILFVGRLVQYKGAIELIKAFKTADFSDDVKLMIVGGETYSSKKITPYVKQCFEEAKGNKNIILTGYVPYEDVPKYYCASDISTLISFVNDAAPLAGLESMAAGLPIITTDRGGIPDYVPNDAKITVCEGEDFTKRLKDALKTLKEDTDLRARMGKASKMQSEKFTKEVYYNTFAGIVEECAR